MAAQLARPHTHLSNRAKIRSALERKPVFKSVLENPFQISWPLVAANIQNIILARLVAALENIPPRPRAARKFSHKTNTGLQENKDIPEEVAYGNIQSNHLALDRPCVDSVSGASSHLVVGINELTRALESQLRLTRKHVQNGDQLSPRPVSPPIVVVFVCCADVDPIALIEHIPYLVAGCNTPKNAAEPIKLVPLPKGSESTISQILGVRRAAVVAFRYGSPLFGTVQDVLDAVPIVSAPWLCRTQGMSRLVPTHIKQLRTTAPKDMKDAKEQRTKARAAAKKHASSSSRSIRRKPRVMLAIGQESSA
ncbi:hypothetical protein JVT61DRAFT_5292 [Boletus reticuloceps]|uniref:Ribosomal protein L7Ae/L30e/S12e/Gadd45 domain-containing protein n=1 Tax=Boletus reticuloceps TaxID=495285 RepID=A0A8I3AFW1_9AGAM|nr:hypothetical protein JVT61DRAFT_5292 [Boletus reticuloceps]